jgi:excisionase family DNA binding protein
MRGLGQYQIDQMKKGDPRIPQVFRALRTVLNLLEDIASRPHLEPERPPEPVPEPPPVRMLAQDRLAYSIKEIRALTGLSNATIYLAIKKGLLRSTKAGGRTLILTQDLQAWMDGWSRRQNTRRN